MKVLKVVAIGLIATTSACSTAGTSSLLGNGPDFQLSGTSKGLDAFYQGHMGVIEGAKSEAGEANLAQDTYRHKESHRTQRKAFEMGANPFATKPQADK